jgi:CBS domain-containing protein
MNNSIAQRIADFLKHYEPFTYLSSDDIYIIATQVKVLYLDKNKVLFQINDKTHENFYIVNSGEISLNITSDSENVLIDKCDDGDIIGLRPFFAKDNYLMTAKAREETILYAIPIQIFRPYVSKNQSVLNFLLESFASNTRNPHSKENKGKLISENVIYNEQITEIQYYQPIKYTKNPITSKANHLIKDIAKKMVDYKIGSIIVEKSNSPIGIITDKDLRSKIATGLFPIDVDAKQIMSTPVITVAENLSIAEAQIMMLKYNVGHLCVTIDGTIHSEIKGIISEHDIVVAQANNPGVLIKQCKRASNSTDLRIIREKLTELIQQSLDNNILINHLCSIAGEINTAISKRAIELAIEKIGTPPPTRFSWMAMGSQGRKEQLLMTDQDNFIIFEDVPDKEYDNVKSYFLQLAERVTKTLNKVGYEFCPANMMASNPQWCKSLTDWKKQFNLWINAPGDNGILMCSIFFDYDLVYGDEAFVDKITQNIFDNTNKNELFFAYLGADAIKSPPPLGFFKQFIVESDGENKDSFDIKARAIMPLIDAARLLALNREIRNINNTYLRFKKLAELEPQNEDLHEACADAFLTLLTFRTEEGLLNENSGRYLNLKELSKLDKIKLKNCFSPIEGIQELIKTRFQLTYFT